MVKLNLTIWCDAIKLSFFFKVNLSYILWVTAFNTSILLSYLVVFDILIFSGSTSGKAAKLHKKGDVPLPVIQIGNPPPLLELINRHGLTIFLLVCFLRFTLVTFILS
jgi:hypothetical protein